MPGITTSASTTSGFTWRARATASSPLSTVTSFTSSLAKLIPTTFWMVTLSSASSRVLGMIPPSRPLARHDRTAGGDLRA
jgi:hypothetical protein